MTRPVIPHALARRIRALRRDRGRIEPPEPLPHTDRRRLAAALPKRDRPPARPDPFELLVGLLQGVYRTDGWTWRLRIPALDPRSDRDGEDWRVHVHGWRDPFHDSLADWLGHAARWLARHVLAPQGILPYRALDLAVAVGEGRDMLGGHGRGLTSRETLNCTEHGPYGDAAILVSSLNDDLPTTLGIVAHELIHVALPRRAGHGRAFREAAAALELHGARDDPGTAGLQGAHDYPRWAYKAAWELGSLPAEPDLHPRRRGLKDGIRFTSCLQAVHLPSRRTANNGQSDPDL